MKLKETDTQTFFVWGQVAITIILNCRTGSMQPTQDLERSNGSGEMF